MPRLPIDYQNCVIYKLVCNDLNVTDTYVGHTTNFRERKSKHKGNCNNVNGDRYHLKVYEFIREHGGWLNWNMIEIEKYPCNDSNEACKKERYWVETLKSTLNMRVPNRTQKEYAIDHAKNIQEYNKEYNEDNANKIKEQKKNWYQANSVKLKANTNCECGGKYSHENKSKHFKTSPHISYCSQIKS